MTGATAVVVAVVLGGAGALARVEIASWTARRWGSRRAGTWVVNLGGAAALGALAGAHGAGAASDALALTLGAGFLGGFTTFSTWMVESLRTSAPGPATLRPRLLLANVVGMTLAGLAAAGGGHLLAGAVW